MNNKYYAIGLLVFMAMVLIYMQSQNEQFANRGEKAATIYDWFIKNGSHTYDKYRRDMNRRSNIVEYEDVLNLFANRNLTIDNVKKVI